MGQRRIRLRPERREEIDLRRLAAAIAALAAEQRRIQEADQTSSSPVPKPDHKEAA